MRKTAGPFIFLSGKRLWATAYRAARALNGVVPTVENCGITETLGLLSRAKACGRRCAIGPAVGELPVVFKTLPDIAALNFVAIGTVRSVLATP